MVTSEETGEFCYSNSALGIPFQKWQPPKAKFSNIEICSKLDFLEAECLTFKFLRNAYFTSLYF